MSSRRRSFCLPLAMAGLLVVSAAAVAAPSTQLAVTGAIATPTTYDLAGLQALPAITQTDTFTAGNGSQTHTYTGASLWGIVNAAGISVNPAIKNDVLNKYVVATGSDGYRSVYSIGEIKPDFGNKADLVAYAETVNNTSAPLGAADGFARTTAVGDVKGGRYVSNLVDLDVRGVSSTQLGTGGGLSTQFSVSGGVSVPMSFNLAALMGLPAITETFGGHTYLGVSFWDLLNTTVGITIDPTIKNDVLDKVVVATGSDGYQTLFSLGELNPAFGNQPDLIAYQVDGASLGANGFARIVVPNDVKAGRWVSNLVNLEVFNVAATSAVAAVPEPSTWALVMAGLTGLGIAAKRRRRALSGCSSAS